MGSGAPALAAGERPLTGTRIEAIVVAVRWSTLAVGLLLEAISRDRLGIGSLAASALLVSLTVLRTLRPLRLDGSRAATNLDLAAELAVVTVALTISGRFDSPFLLSALPTVTVAGLGHGYVVGIGSAATIVGVLAIADAIVGPDDGAFRAAVQTAVLLGLTAVLGGYARQLWRDAEERRRRDLEEITQMVTANDLLAALHTVVQTLPASLDLGEVAASTRRRFQELFELTSAVLLVRDDTTDSWQVELADGVRLPATLSDDDLPALLARAARGPDPVIVADQVINSLPGCSPTARSAIATALRARDRVVGLVSVEHVEPHRYNDRDAELLEGLAAPLALAVDNARWFGRLRTLGAEAERARIARDLHDRLAQSLVYVTFELDRLADQRANDAELTSLRDVVRDVVRELRETLYQLRTEVTDDASLESVANDYIARYRDRTGIEVLLATDTGGQRLAIPVEQELWRILQEALANVERHSGADKVWVSWAIAGPRAWLEVRDDGRGFAPRDVRADGYGLRGMRERADAIGARLTTDSTPSRGTRVLVEIGGNR